MSKQAGFTLIEILVAVAILGILSVGAYSVLDAGMRARVHMEQRLAELEKVQRAVGKIEQDLQRLVPRVVRNEFGDKQALLIGESDTSGQLAQLAFTRGDWRNPAQLPRANLQHVLYKFENGQLQRGHRLFLDAASNSVTILATLLEDVESFQLGFLTKDNQWLDAWGMFAQNDQLMELPLMVRMRLEIAPFGVIERMIPIPVTSIAKPGDQSNQNQPDTEAPQAPSSDRTRGSLGIGG
jgi:general secretion pathway protein J